MLPKKRLVVLSLLFVLVFVLSNTVLAAIPTVSSSPAGTFPQFDDTLVTNRWYVTEDPNMPSPKQIDGVDYEVKVIANGTVFASQQGFSFVDNSIVYLDGRYSYLFEGQYLCDRPNFALIGDGQVTLSKTASAAYGLGFSGSNRMIKNITLKMNNPADSVNYFIMVAGVAENIFIDNVEIMPFPNAGNGDPNKRQVALNINGAKHVYVNDFSATDVKPAPGRGSITIANSTDINFTGTINVASDNILIEPTSTPAYCNGINFFGGVTADSFVINSYNHSGITVPADYQFASCYPTGMLITNSFPTLVPANNPLGVVDLATKTWIAAAGLYGANPSITGALAQIDGAVTANPALGLPPRNIKLISPDSFDLPVGQAAYNIYAVNDAAAGLQGAYVNPFNINNLKMNIGNNTVTLHNFNFVPYTQAQVTSSIISGGGTVNFVNCLFYTPRSGSGYVPPNPTTPTTPTNNVPYAEVTGIGTGDTRAKINVYEKSTLKGKVLLKLAKGDEFNILSVYGKYAFVEANDIKGYVALSKINGLFTAYPQAVTAKKCHTYEEAKAKSALRVSKNLPKDVALEVLEWAGSWVRVAYTYEGEEFEAWIQASNIKFVVD